MRLYTNVGVIDNAIGRMVAEMCAGVQTISCL